MREAVLWLREPGYRFLLTPARHCPARSMTDAPADPCSPAVVCGCRNCVTSCDLRVFVDDAAEPVPAQNARTSGVVESLRAARVRVLLQCPE